MRQVRKHEGVTGLKRCATLKGYGKINVNKRKFMKMRENKGKWVKW
jgi:hypothetical protein